MREREGERENERGGERVSQEREIAQSIERERDLGIKCGGRKSMMTKVRRIKGS